MAGGGGYALVRGEKAAILAMARKEGMSVRAAFADADGDGGKSFAMTHHLGLVLPQGLRRVREARCGRARGCQGRRSVDTSTRERSYDDPAFAAPEAGGSAWERTTRGVAANLAGCRRGAAPGLSRQKPTAVPISPSKARRDARTDDDAAMVV
nr:unnamed protein product [Digitaria exilis]